MMDDSPCHYCPKCPCKEHDTCPDYLKYRAKKDAKRAKKIKEGIIIAYTCASIQRMNKRKGRK